MWPVVKDLCDNACWLVVLVRCRATGGLLAYCCDCGAAWTSPAALRANDFVIGSEVLPEGIEVPRRDEVDRSIWAETVLEFIPESEFSGAPEINKDLAWDRTMAFRQPVPERPATRQAESFTLRWFERWDELVSWFRGRPSAAMVLRRAPKQAQKDTKPVAS